jgi:hypothetical protein
VLKCCCCFRLLRYVLQYNVVSMLLRGEFYTPQVLVPGPAGPSTNTRIIQTHRAIPTFHDCDSSVLLRATLRVLRALNEPRARFGVWDGATQIATCPTMRTGIARWASQLVGQVAICVPPSTISGPKSLPCPVVTCPAMCTGVRAHPAPLGCILESGPF